MAREAAGRPRVEKSDWTLEGLVVGSRHHMLGPEASTAGGPPRPGGAGRRSSRAQAAFREE